MFHLQHTRSNLSQTLKCSFNLKSAAVILVVGVIAKLEIGAGAFTD